MADGVDDVLQSWLVAEAVAQLSASHQDVIRECYFAARAASGGPLLRPSRGNSQITAPSYNTGHGARNTVRPGYYHRQ